MNEFEIYQIAHFNFINNAICTVAVIFMTCISFYLIRRAREINFPSYEKIILSSFCLCTIFFGLQVLSYLVLNQKNMSFQLSEINANGVEISAVGESFISLWGQTVADGPASLAPDISSTVLWATIFLMFVFGIWEKAPKGSYEK